MKILIVEDNEENRNLLAKQLLADGHQVMAAANGAEALEQALAQPPDIIVSDILMPKMDGYQLCRECKQNNQLKNISFVFYTATYTLDEDKKFALSLGADNFLIKPTEPDVLVRMLSEIVEKAQSGALAPVKTTPLEQSLFLPEYARRISAKLEYKVAELEVEITERKQAEEEVKKAAEDWKTTFDSITDLVSICDKDFRLIKVNKAFADAVKMKPEELIGKHCYEMIHGTSEPVLNCPHKKTLETKKPARTEFFESHLGIHLELSTSPIFDEKGEVVASVHLIRDITERKQADEEIKNLAKFPSENQNPVLRVAKDGTILYANEASTPLLNVWGSQLVRRLPDSLHKLTLEALSSGSSQTIEVESDNRILSLTIAPVAETDYASIYGLDVTERKQAVEDLSRLNLELEERVKERTGQLEEAVQTAEVASRAKSDFLASMSHELRTPLNAIIGFSQVLQEQYFGKLNEKQVEYVTDVLESGQHLLSLINDILDLAKIEAGKMELGLSKVKIKDLLEGSLVMVKEKALVHGISLDINTTGDLEYLEIIVDERRVKQVMFNLLSNAVKFTPDSGAIRVEGKKEGKEVIISVSDTGIGIAPEDQERIFEGFYQASGAINNKTPGTGLGLPVTRSIVEMHGGRIWVESEGKDKGSRFTFSLPT